MNNCNCCCEFVKLTHSTWKNGMGANKNWCNWFCGINRYFKEQGYNGFPQINTVPLQIFYNGCLQYVLWNKHSVLEIMDRFKCSREIMTDRRNGLLQLMSWNNRLSPNVYMPETKEVSKLITVISSYYNSSCSEKIL